MSNEWKENLLTEQLFALKREGWEIEYRHMNKEQWQPWYGFMWQDNWKFRARPRQQKMKKVKLLAWLDMGNELRTLKEGSFANSTWTRVPSEDKEVEIPE